jgi:hypothetical protein
MSSDKQSEIEFMLKQFKLERYAYLTVSILSFALLITCVVFFLLNKSSVDSKDLGIVAGMTGSGGAVAYTASQLLRMWRDCMTYLSGQPNNEKNG